MKITDNLLSDCILKNCVKLNISNMAANLFPLLLSTLWLHGL